MGLYLLVVLITNVAHEILARDCRDEGFASNNDRSKYIAYVQAKYTSR